MAPLAERTIKYKTYLKRSLVDALRQVYAGHPDTELQKTKVTIDFPTSKNQYPTVIIRFFEREIKNIGVGSVEYILTDDSRTYLDKYKHYIYNGDVEFAVFALSSLDRDYLADSLIQTIAMGDLLSYTNKFYQRIYPEDPNPIPDSYWNYINLNSDVIQGFGETQTPAPWQPEDVLVYQVSYRCGVMGEFYSLPPLPNTVGPINKVNLYPYIEGIDALPTGVPGDPSQWQ